MAEGLTAAGNFNIDDAKKEYINYFLDFQNIYKN